MAKMKSKLSREKYRWEMKKSIYPKRIGKRNQDFRMPSAAISVSDESGQMAFFECAASAEKMILPKRMSIPVVRCCGGSNAEKAVRSFRRC